MNIIEFSTPAPSCLVPITHPARAVCRDADVSRTFEQYRTTDLMDDYELTEQTGHLDMMGEFAK